MILKLKSIAHSTDTGSLKQEYKARIPKRGEQGFDRLSLLVQFKSADLTATLINFKNISYWDCDYDRSNPFNKFKVPDEPLLNLKFKELGLNDKQSKAVAQGLIVEFEQAFDGSGLDYNPCEAYFRMLREYEYVKDWGLL